MVHFFFTFSKGNRCQISVHSSMMVGFKAGACGDGAGGGGGLGVGGGPGGYCLELSPQSSTSSAF